MAGRAKVRWHSVSSTREYEGCPRRYRFGYVERRPKDRPVPPTWRFGSVVHEALEAAYQGAMAAPGTPPSAHVAAAIADHLTREGQDPACATTWGYGLVGFIRAAADAWMATGPRAPRSEVLAHMDAFFTSALATGLAAVPQRQEQR